MTVLRKQKISCQLEKTIVELEVRSIGPTQVSHTGQKTFLPLGEMDLEQTLKLILHPTPTHPMIHQSMLWAKYR